MYSVLIYLSILFSFIFYSCSSLKNYRGSDKVYIVFIDSTLFPDYYYIDAILNKDSIQILSHKLKSIYFKNRIENNRSYSLELEKLDSDIVTRSKIASYTGNVVINDGKKVIYSNGKIYGNLYISPNLFGIYLRAP